MFLLTDWTVCFLVVASLELGYHRMIEVVYPWQITRIERKNEHAKEKNV